ncbi:AGC/PKA protein kinase [Mycena chlorophos]|uniref:AGC/PKA protein kinase n=1 Tax=Mycena chlorophos TaxID=658473 RepID=A0A8H6RYJ7_MYCCL|nr:AGC/PKA protein kinase [Mycena chlorophos]
MLATIPVDIVYQIIQHLELVDAVPLLLTCKVLHQLATERNFWILSLNTARTKSALRCPPNEYLGAFSLAKLQDIAASKLRLDRNWATARPRLVQPCTVKTKLPERTIIIHNVQGTDVLLLYALGSREVYCWDKREGRLFPGLEHKIAMEGVITSVSAPADSDGRSCESVSLLVRSNTLSRTFRQFIITIRYEDGKAVSMEHYSFGASKPPQAIQGIASLFFNADVSGCVSRDAQDNIWLSIAPRPKNEPEIAFQQVVNLHGDAERRMTCNFTYRGHIYNAREELQEDDVNKQPGVKILHVSRQMVQSGNYEQAYEASNLYRVAHDSDEGAEWEWAGPSICFNLPTKPEYGICALFVGVTEATVDFTFVPCALADAPDDDEGDDGVVSPLAFPHPLKVARVPGSLVNRTIIWLDHSGCNAATVIEGPNGVALTLVRYHPGTASGDPAWTSQHQLEVPDDIDLKQIRSCCIDDSAGTVHLITEEGDFFTLNYA